MYLFSFCHWLSFVFTVIIEGWKSTRNCLPFFSK